MIGRILHLGRRGHSHRVSHHRGFTLVEVLMSVVLMGIGMALALPSYRDMVEKRQVTNGAEQLAAFINTAQGVAMKTNQLVTVSYNRVDTDDWCIGAISGAVPCDCTQTNTAATDYCQIGAQPFLIHQGHANDRDLVHAMVGDGSYAFDPIRGLFQDLDDALTLELRSQSEDFRLNLVVNNTGRVTLCSASAEHAVPGYAVCPPQFVVGDGIEVEGEL